MELLDWIWKHGDALLGAVGAVGVAAEGGALALLTLAKLLAGLARLTRWEGDDHVLARVIRGLEAFASWIPRLRTTKRPPEDAIGPMLAVAIVFGFATMAGCGGSGVEVVRGTAAGGALAVVAADPILASAYDRAAADFEARTLDEASYVERLKRLDRAERALRSLSSSLTAVDLALAAYEDGQECGLRPALEGAARTAREVVEAFDDAGLDVPSLVSGVLDLAAVFADAPECEPDELAAVSP